MRILYCKTCRDDVILPDGKPYLLQRFPGNGPLTVKCSQCGRKTTLTASEFARLPAVSVEDVEPRPLRQRPKKAAKAGVIRPTRDRGDGGRAVFPLDDV